MGSMSEERRRERAERFFRRLEESLGSEIAKAAADELAAAEAAGPTIAVDKPDPTGLSASENVRVRQPPTPYSGGNSGRPYSAGQPSLGRRFDAMRGPARLAPEARDRPCLTAADIELLIAALGTHYDPDEAEVIARVLKEYGGTMPDKQLISEAALALAIWRRGRR